MGERSRSRPRSVAGRAKSAVDSDDDDAMSVKNVARYVIFVCNSLA
jgi:hypothetical protein